MAKPQYRWPPGLRTFILDRDNWQCQIRRPGCKAPQPGELRQLPPHQRTVDHIRDTVGGGSWFDPNNLRAACRHCNSSLNGGQTRKLRGGQTDPGPSRRW